MDQKLEKRLYKKFTFLRKKDMPSIDCGDGWYDAIHTMCLELRELNKPSDFIVTKIFEKYKDLKVHTKNGTLATRSAVDEAMDIANETCNACGFLKEAEQCDKCIVLVIEYPDPEPECATCSTEPCACVTAVPAPANACSSCPSGSCTCSNPCTVCSSSPCSCPTTCTNCSATPCVCLPTGTQCGTCWSNPCACP